MKYELLQQLLHALEEYESQPNQTGSNQLADFAQWLSAKHKTAPAPPVEVRAIAPQGDNPAQITQLITLMYKYIKFYLRKIFEPTALRSPDDFGFLATLFIEGSLQKHELIEKNTLEFSSGVEIIKRLEQKGLILSEEDPNDRRARRVSLSPLGHACFFGIMPDMAKVGKLAMGNLNDSEQILLLDLLHRLNHFHAPIFQQEKLNPAADIFEKYG
jgi:MarR family transcriptional regulator, lower aerobic nicotinate degradation pathway regulator